MTCDDEDKKNLTQTTDCVGHRWPDCWKIRSSALIRAEWVLYYGAIMLLHASAACVWVRIVHDYQRFLWRKRFQFSKRIWWAVILWVYLKWAALRGMKFNCTKYKGTRYRYDMARPSCNNTGNNFLSLAFPEKWLPMARYLNFGSNFLKYKLNCLQFLSSSQINFPNVKFDENKIWYKNIS